MDERARYMETLADKARQAVEAGCVLLCNEENSDAAVVLIGPACASPLCHPKN